MKAYEIEWDVDVSELYDRIDDMTVEHAAETLEISPERYAAMSTEERHDLVWDKWRHEQAWVNEILQLLDEVEIPDEVEENTEFHPEAISDWLTDTYGYCHQGFSVSIDSDPESSVKKNPDSPIGNMTAEDILINEPSYFGWYTQILDYLERDKDMEICGGFLIIRDDRDRRYYYVDAEEPESLLRENELDLIAELNYDIIHDVRGDRADELFDLFECDVSGEYIYDDGISYLWFDFSQAPEDITF